MDSYTGFIVKHSKTTCKTKKLNNMSFSSFDAISAQYFSEGILIARMFNRAYDPRTLTFFIVDHSTIVTPLARWDLCIWAAENRHIKLLAKPKN